MEMELRQVSCGYVGKAIVSDVSLTVRSGDLLCLLGPNGVGKTTLFKSILGLHPIMSGSIRLDGEDVRHWRRRRFALAVGYVPQGHIPPFPFKVLDVVVMGRAAHFGAFSAPNRTDFAVAEDSLTAVGLPHLRDAVYTEISGGERQLVLIARALAQRLAFLFMDEPTANLDYGNQIRILDHIRALTGQGLGVVMTTHNPNDALLYASDVAILESGGSLVAGKPDTVITEALLDRLYGVDIRLMPIDGRTARICVPR